MVLSKVFAKPWLNCGEIDTASSRNPHTYQRLDNLICGEFERTTQGKMKGRGILTGSPGPLLCQKPPEIYQQSARNIRA